MEITPNNKLWLLKNVDLDPNYNYTIDFDSLSAQENYFNEKIFTEFTINDGYSYTRDSRAIKIELPIDKMFGINYFMFENEETNKRYYAFILSKEWVRADVTAVTFKIDVMQSFMFDYDLEESFIEREHQDRFLKSDNNLFPIYNIEDEQLEMGTDYKIKSSQKIKDNVNAPDNLVWYEIIATQPIVEENYSNTDPTLYKNRCSVLNEYNIYTGVYVYLLPKIIGKDKNFYTIDGTGAIQQLNSTYIERFIARSTAVIAIRVLHYSPITYEISDYKNGYLLKFPSGYKDSNPYDVTAMRVVTAKNSNFGGVDLSNYGGYYLNLSRLEKSNTNSKLNLTIKPVVIGNDIDINNLKNIKYETKMMTNPYYYYQLCDYQSTPLKVKNEFIDNEKDIIYIQSIAVQQKNKLFINNYNNDNGKEYNTINSTISELPLTNDAYISYMAQNKASATTGVALNIAGAVANLGLGLATGGIGLAVAGSNAIGIGNNIAQTLLKRTDLKNTPDSIRQLGNNAEFDIIDNNFQIVITEFEITDKFKNKIFNYFFHYGYKCNDFKKPNLKSRYYFNYIKTIGVNIKTGIDADFKAELVNIFNNGVTIFHYRDNTTFKGVNNFDYENVEMSIIGGNN